VFGVFKRASNPPFPVDMTLAYPLSRVNTVQSRGPHERRVQKKISLLGDFVLSLAFINVNGFWGIGRAFYVWVDRYHKREIRTGGGMKISNQIHSSLLGRIASIVNDPRSRRGRVYPLATTLGYCFWGT
jgi:hypothetical protein